MEYFENIVKRLLEQKGYWVRESVRVNLTRDEKYAIGKYSIPRPEIDLVGYKPRDNELLVIEVKSFLDSMGVRYSDLIEVHKKPTGRYKLFTCSNYRRIVLSRLRKDCIQKQLILGSAKIKFGLAVGNIPPKDEPLIQKYFKRRNWVLYTPSEIAGAIEELADLPYENDPYVIAAKILMKNRKSAGRTTPST